MLNPELLEGIDPVQIPVIAPWLGGKFFFSKRQRAEMDHTHPRLFFQLSTDLGKPIEYTEMFDWDKLDEDVDIISEYEDAIFLGYGYFHSMGT